MGWGFDAHRFDDEPPLILAGVVVDESRGVAAHSDGDLVAHAVIDALLGAAALGDIGDHFPADDDRWVDADSLQMLATVVGMVETAGWTPVHTDVTVICEDVRIAPHRKEMRRRLADILGLGDEAVSVKATTTDGMMTPGVGLSVVAVATVRADGGPVAGQS